MMLMTRPTRTSARPATTPRAHRTAERRVRDRARAERTDAANLGSSAYSACSISSSSLCSWSESGTGPSLVAPTSGWRGTRSVGDFVPVASDGYLHEHTSRWAGSKVTTSGRLATLVPMAVSLASRLRTGGRLGRETRRDEWGATGQAGSVRRRFRVIRLGARRAAEPRRLGRPFAHQGGRLHRVGAEAGSGGVDGGVGGVGPAGRPAGFGGHGYGAHRNG